MRAIVLIHVERALALTSPAYDLGATEDELREQYVEYFRELHAP